MFVTPREHKAPPSLGGALDMHDGHPAEMISTGVHVWRLRRLTCGTDRQAGARVEDVQARVGSVRAGSGRHKPPRGSCGASLPVSDDISPAT